MANWYLHSGLVFQGNLLQRMSVLILDGKIAASGPKADELRAGLVNSIREFDASNCVISPGFVDLHTHLREPGFEQKETISSGTKAAARGGFTTVCAMPNTNPPIDSLESLNALNNRIKKDAQVTVYPIAALTKGRLGNKPVDYKSLACAGIRLFSDDGDPLEAGIAEEVFLGIKEVDGVLINHLEDKSLIQEGFFYKQIPPESEYLMLERDLELVAKTNCRYHAAHLSCKEAVQLIAKAKDQGLPVTAEVTPHHLTLTYNDVEEPPGHFQMKPPLRLEEDRLALVEGLNKGVIDFVATDHAPHGQEKEEGLYEGSPFGVTALETAFPVLYTDLVLTGVLSLERLLVSLTIAPAELLMLAKDLTVGCPADLTVIDLKQAKTVNKNDFFSLGTNSPYLGRSLRGWPALTFCNGKVVFEERSQ